MENEQPNEIIFKSAVLHEKKFDDAKTTVECIITAESMDRDNDIVSRDGIDIKRYKQNPVVLFNHNYDKIVGKNLRLNKKTLEDGTKGIHGVTQFAPTEFGQELYSLAKNGFLNAWSIGFIPTEWETRKDDKGHGWNIYKSELLEYSAVSVPSNPDALTTRKLFKALSDYSENTQREFTNGLELNHANELAELRTELDEKMADIDTFKKSILNNLFQIKLAESIRDGLPIDPDQIYKKLQKELLCQIK